jgi:quercetin dioxygenase-like cupin family protein
MKTIRTGIALGSLATLSVATGLLLSNLTLFGQQRTAAPAPAPVKRVKPEDLKWTSKPEELGFKTAIVEGDPEKAGIYVIQVKFPPWVMSKPHFHPEARYATVLKGTWYTGDGDVFAPDKTVPLKPGSFMLHPPNAHHYDGAKDEEVIIEIVGIGPSKTTRMHPEEGLFASSKTTK